MKSDAARPPSPATALPPELGWLDELNLQQRAAATAGDGPVLVVAGAGTGKTRTLACRVAVLVCRGVAPSRIMLLTFTRRAAGVMLSQAAAVLRQAAARAKAAGVPLPETVAGQDGLQRVWGGTFHAVANRLLRVYSESLGLAPNFTVMDQGDAEDLMNLLRHERGLSGKDRRFPRKTTCLAIYSRTVNSDEPLAHTLKTDFPWCAQWQAELKGLFAAYTDAKQARAVLDYDDLLLYWQHLLADDAFAAKIEARFDHILVDEYQDTNRLQAAILQRLRSRNRNLMVVGDDAQSIYGFRAADVHNILDFPTQFPGAQQITLEQNYRSRQPILAATNQIIAQAPVRYTKNLWSARGGEQKPYLVTCEREEEQTDFVVRHILEHLEQGIPLRRQAVLFRTAHWSAQLELELGRRGIPYQKYGGLKFLEAAHVKDLLAFLRIVENPRDQLAWTRVLHLIEGVGPTTAAKCFAQVAANSYDPRALAGLALPAAARDGVRALAHLLAELLTAGQALPLPGQIQRLREFYTPRLEKLYENPEPRRRDLEQLEHLAGNYRSRQKFLTELTLDPPLSTADFAGRPTLDDDWLTLSTIHSAKGCEWDVVFLIHAADGILPSDLATGDAEQLAEERRLLYVACTRARDWLYVAFPLRYYAGKHALGDAHGYAQLTRFIPPTLRPAFETLAVSRPDAEDAPEPAGERAQNLHRALRSRWE